MNGFISFHHYILYKYKIYLIYFINEIILYIIIMTKHRNNDYKLTAVQYYLIVDKTQEEV